MANLFQIGKVRIQDFWTPLLWNTKIFWNTEIDLFICLLLEFYFSVEIFHSCGDISITGKGFEFCPIQMANGMWAVRFLLRDTGHPFILACDIHTSCRAFGNESVTTSFCDCRSVSLPSAGKVNALTDCATSAVQVSI